MKNISYRSAATMVNRYKTASPKVPSKDDKYVEGVRIRYVWWIGMGGAMTLPGIGIFVGKKTLKNPTYNGDYLSNLIMHEYGHILQAKQDGLLNYYGRIVPISFGSATWATTTNLFNSIIGNRDKFGDAKHYDHKRTWTEWDASYKAYHFFNYTYWNKIWFPIHKTLVKK